jgi:hypothetical protein
MTLHLYVFEDETGTLDTYTTTNLGKAQTYARRYQRALIAQEFEFSDSELIEDNRPETEDQRG